MKVSEIAEWLQGIPRAIPSERFTVWRRWRRAETTELAYVESLRIA